MRSLKKIAVWMDDALWVFLGIAALSVPMAWAVIDRAMYKADVPRDE
jgi:hypothetical protein